MTNPVKNRSPPLVDSGGHRRSSCPHLTDLAPGDTIEVEREDGAVAVFAVDRGVTYGKDEFPTDEVYGDTDAPELRLITCDGYNAFTREFEENHIVYATLVDVY